MKPVYFVERTTNTNKDIAGKRVGKKKETWLGMVTIKEKMCVFSPLKYESVLLSEQVIELQRTDVSITSSYLRLQNNTINLDRLYTGSQGEVARPTYCKYSFVCRFCLIILYTDWNPNLKYQNGWWVMIWRYWRHHILLPCLWGRLCTFDTWSTSVSLSRQEKCKACSFYLNCT